MTNEPKEQVEPCYRCGQPAERPAIASGHVGGQEQEHMPLCVACLALLLEDARAFWDGLRRKPPTG
jgi:hypothetical protein